METIDNNIVENCMNWLTDLSVYRNRLQKLQHHLQCSKTQFSLKGKFEKYISLTRELQTALKKIQSIESRVIHTINVHENELYIPHLNKWSDLQNEDELFENMMTANRVVLELQRSISSCFKDSKDVEHPSLLVEMPLAKKVKQQQA